MKRAGVGPRCCGIDPLEPACACVCLVCVYDDGVVSSLCLSLEQRTRKRLKKFFLKDFEGTSWTVAIQWKDRPFKVKTTKVSFPRTGRSLRQKVTGSADLDTLVVLLPFRIVACTASISRLVFN